MGIIKGKFIVGAVGPVVYKVVKGKNIVSSKMVKGSMKQTKGTIRAAGTFGIANRLSGEIMHSLQKLLGGLQDDLMYKRLSVRLNDTLYTAREGGAHRYNFTGLSLHTLNDFDFNSKSPLRASLRSVPAISFNNGQLRLVLNGLDDPQTIIYPMHAKSCEIVATVSLFRLQDGVKIPAAEYQRLKLKRNQKDISSHEFVFSIPAGCMCIVSLFIYYYSVSDNYLSVLNHKRFSPGTICAAFFVPGIYNSNDHRKWEIMDRLQIN